MTDDRLAENTARYRIWSGDGMRAASLTEDPAEFSVIRCDPESGTWSRSWTIRELDDRATEVRDLSWLESGALLHITYETERFFFARVKSKIFPSSFTPTRQFRISTASSSGMSGHIKFRHNHYVSCSCISYNLLLSLIHI